jgi:signal transduction histidine kinase
MSMTDEDLLLELDRRFKECKKMLDEQKELSRELAVANKKLIESEALKSHFISSITNEIINPFASVLGLSRNILLVKNGDWNKVSTMAKMIYSEASGLDFQFRNIFAAAKIEAGDVSVESVDSDISDLLEQAIESLKHEAEKRNILISVKDNFNQKKFNTDPDKLRLIVMNLLSNAIKFSKDDDEVILYLEKDANKLVITVEDHGSGIENLENETIFDRFVKGDSQINSINPGHGIGLSVVKSYTELLGGSVEFVNSPGSGCCFTVRIPESDTRTGIYNFLEAEINGNDLNNEIF